MLKGSCACNRVQYEIHGVLHKPISYCHCWRCRKHSGSSFGTTAAVKPEELIFTQGKDLLSYWESSPNVKRFFASCCGSPIYKSDDNDLVFLGFRLGTLDVDPEVEIQEHFMINSKAPWVVITDELTQIKGSGTVFGKRD